MKKIIIIMISIIVIIMAIFFGIAVFTPGNNNQNEEKIEVEIAEEEILDDCTDEYERMEYENIINTSTQEEKISPNCSIIIKTYYKQCGHTKNEYDNLPQELVNLTKDEVKEKYPEYKIESFASNEIVLYQEKEEQCGEHYMVKDKDGIVTIYQILDDGSQKELEKTSISTEYLPETDKINMKKGIQVNGKQELNQLIEDFE